MSYQDYADRHQERYFKSLRNPPSDESRDKSTPTKSHIHHMSPKNAMLNTPSPLVPPSAIGHGMSLGTYSEVYMSLKVKSIQCTGRADYAIGYGSETFLVIIEAKSLVMGKAASQALFYYTSISGTVCFSFDKILLSQ